MAAAPADSQRPRPEPFIPSRIEGPPPSQAAVDQPVIPAAAAAASPSPAPEPAPSPEPPIARSGPIAYPPRPTEARGTVPDGGSLTPSAGCTAPQLRRFIKSRPYVPMHELRRRFGINGQEDDVTPVDLVNGRIFVGLPSREGGLLGELLRGGEVGYELSLDPRSPIVVGLYPMRPVPRS